MEKVGILVVSYGARGVAIVDALSESRAYRTDIVVVDKQRNPFNLRKASEHVVVPDLDVNTICKFASRRQHKIDFAVIGPEKPIINGLRDALEEATRIAVISPTKRCAIEGSKVAQRRIFEEAAPSVNPKFKIFDPADYSSTTKAKRDLFSWLDQLENLAVVKPDVPAAGKGVGVWGDHFTTREQLFEHFLENYRHGQVIVEEKIDGEESSFQALCDGNHIVALPETRDYKRAFDEDKGPNTGGMGSYKGPRDILPFMFTENREEEIAIANKVFDLLRKRYRGEELRGLPFYVAFIHSSQGLKILENNSRPGDPEIMNLLPLLKDDLVDISYRIIEGNLAKVEVQRKASVVTYKVPPTYAGYIDKFPEKIVKDDVGTPVKLEGAYKLRRTLKENVRIYPASMEVREGETHAMTSRAVAVVGISDTITEARELSMKGIDLIEGGALWNRSDIASPDHIRRSIEHMSALRRNTG